MNHWMNDKGVCRTTPATPGLLIINMYCANFLPGFHPYESVHLFKLGNLASFTEVGTINQQWQKLGHFINNDKSWDT